MNELLHTRTDNVANIAGSDTGGMADELIALLPSADLKAMIRKENVIFSDEALLQILYRYAPTYDSRLTLLARFSEIASADSSALARCYMDHEREAWSRFLRGAENIVYELHIKDTPDAYDERYLCASFDAALICIDRFYEEYRSAKENESSRYRIVKRRIFDREDTFAEDVMAECLLGEGKVVLEVDDYQSSIACDEESLSCTECKRICPRRCDEIRFPCFASDLALLRYRDYEGREKLGVNLCLSDACDGRETEYYVVPLSSSTIQEHHFDNDFYAHEHVALPLATLASPQELSETNRKNYEDFVSYWRARRARVQAGEEKL